jgi:hypothetical protein
MPNPLAWWAHHLPDQVHHLEVLLTFFEQLLLPFLLLVPARPVRLFAGVAAVLFQLAIVVTGNYAWINFVGALPALATFDDSFLAATRLFSAATGSSTLHPTPYTLHPTPYTPKS